MSLSKVFTNIDIHQAPSQGRTDHLETRGLPGVMGSVGGPIDAPGTFFKGFFEFGQGHRCPMIPYCPGAP
ncbi:unnamed protein product [Staurois parvus]|uniref:Uncharacterized protein n=1 Tax=Staurois parvus TaxID=386267 RepID=A0ABN9D3I5_9NEOB|nr:unnamed protein product [Staurois parvus]